MIDKSKQNITLQVCLEDAGDHNKAVLDFFFAKLGQHIFRRVDSQEGANVLIIDYDYPPARQRYEDYYRQWNKPTIVLSIAPVELEGVIWLAKPLTSRALLDAAEKIQAQFETGLPAQTVSVSSEKPSVALSEDTTSNQSFGLVAKSPLLRPEIKEPSALAPNIPLVSDTSNSIKVESSDDSQSEHLADPDKTPESPSPVQNQSPLLSEQEQQARWEALCGSFPDIEPSSDVSAVQAIDRFFLSSLKDAVRLARQCQQGVLLNFPQARIYVLPEIHRVFCGINLYSAEFESFIQTCSADVGGKMHILSTQEIHELNDMISQHSDALYDMESFVWTSSLLSAKGLLSTELDPSKGVGLKHWPSLTRLEQFPDVMPIAALWSSASHSAFEIAKILDIPQRYVFSFYNASNALGLIEQDADKLIQKQATSRPAEAPRGLFSRLLKRLIGG